MRQGSTLILRVHGASPQGTSWHVEGQCSMHVLCPVSVGLKCKCVSVSNCCIVMHELCDHGRPTTCAACAPLPAAAACAHGPPHPVARPPWLYSADLLSCRRTKSMAGTHMMDSCGCGYQYAPLVSELSPQLRLGLA